MMLARRSESRGIANAFVARQPIFNARGDVQGYELIFRDGPLTNVIESELDTGTLRSLDTAFLVHGIEALTGGVPAYLSFSTATLIDDFALLFPAKSIAVQIGPYVRFGDAVVEACSRLSRRGYRLVLTDYLGFSWVPPHLLHFVDVIKVDCRGARDMQLAEVAQTFREHRAELAAENLDTQIGWHHAQKLGFTLFQGRCLASPEVVESPEISVGKIERLRLLQELNRDEIDPTAIEEIIKHDPTLSFKLLMFANSAASGVRLPIRSIRQAVMMFGRLGMLRWASVIALREAAEGRPAELVREALFRGKFCEGLASLDPSATNPGEMFLLGLFAEVDLLLSRPRDEVVAMLPLSLELKDALLGAPGAERRLLDICTGYEQGTWPDVRTLTREAGIDETSLPSIYHDAVQWSASLAS
ncbi:MAG: EAL and HDOD domain-containing protein [Chloroflexota bacterium]